MTWGKQAAFIAISNVFALLMLACLGEIALRLLPLGKYRSAPFRQYDPVIGISLIPNMHVNHARGCFQGEVSTNRWGMRDRDRTLEKPPGDFRIAMIGDSVVEAVHVKPDQVVNIRTEERLRQLGYSNVEVMNFAVEGIGTTQELLLYKEKVRQFHPDLVLLMFTATNDILNNSSTLQPKIYGIHHWFAPYYDLAPDGKLVFTPVEPRHLNRLRSYFERHSVLVYYLERVWLKVNLFPYKWQGLPIDFETYEDDPMDNELKQAWQVTGKVLTIMNDTVNADGSKFLVLVWPLPYDIDPDWRQRMMKQYGTVPASFNPFRSAERLQAIADSNHIPMEFLAPYAQAYRDQRHLQWPYFSLPCDTHLNALGHEESAEAITEILEKRNLLPAQTQQSTKSNLVN
ncbi:putative Lipolytic protein G-D-S-L family [Candidatus Sulfotelmatobacter kueseliae]|uniref:Putative Lipolytic protein G-D-S-L family n=1 Tax=Candidatus Sulfotelmatobacter kueseliae TaxID=2042962 RepID=A0A2U3KW63_9BACT|nr:putative Lipolytic protein G-D-S-L family [Candidatus Sulfotelmatobacter kueseliae]